MWDVPYWHISCQSTLAVTKTTLTAPYAAPAAVVLSLLLFLFATRVLVSGANRCGFPPSATTAARLCVLTEQTVVTKLDGRQAVRAGDTIVSVAGTSQE